MSILNFRKQRQYTKNKSGQYDLVSNWTSAETVYDRDGHCVMERLDNALLPMVDGTDNGKLLTVKNGGWTKDMVIPNVDNEDDGKMLIVDDGEWTKTQNPIIDQSKNAYTFGTRDDEDTVGDYSVVEGNNNAASGDYSHAEGSGCTASGWYTHAEGQSTTASLDAAHAEGCSTTASGSYSHAEGHSTKALSNYSHAEGYGCEASTGAWYQHAEGQECTAKGDAAHAEGCYTTAVGNYSHSSGLQTYASSKSQFVFGEYNEIDGSDNKYYRNTYVEIVGNGTEDARSDARRLKWTGDEWLAGKLTTTDVIKTAKWDGTNTSLQTAITAIRNSLPTSTTSNGWYVTKFPNIKFAICRYVDTTKHTGGTKSYSTTAAPFTFKNATVSVSAMVAGRTDTVVQYTNVATNGVEAYVSCGVSSATNTRVVFTVFTDYD